MFGATLANPPISLEWAAGTGGLTRTLSVSLGDRLVSRNFRNLSRFPQWPGFLGWTLIDNGPMTATVLVIFGLVYLGMILGGLPFLQLDRTGIALLGRAGANSGPGGARGHALRPGHGARGAGKR